jgi:protein TonB
VPRPGPRLHSALSLKSSLLIRVIENLESVWTPPHVAVAANNAPIHLFETREAHATTAAQFGSAGAHGVFIAALVFMMLHPPAAKQRDPHSGMTPIPTLQYAPPKWAPAAEEKPGGKSSNSGDHSPLAPTAGEPAPLSKLNLASPRLPDGRRHPLPEPVTVYAADAPELTPPVREIGLPWMPEKNDSAGHGKRGIGTGDREGMGPDGDSGSGVGKDGIYTGPVATRVVCKICLDPLYSDEARKQKLQGTITMQVLVGTDGRAQEIKVTRGLGLGLDENAVNAVRTWQFTPAKDGARRPVASWITVETLFRLY